MQGLNNLQAQYQKEYGPGDYIPNVFIQYWSMRVMAYGGGIVMLVGLWGLLLARRKKLGTSRRFLWCATWLVVLPFVINTAGWLLTESGRQPWIIQGIMLTKNGISPTVSTLATAVSLGVFVLLYATLATVDLLLMLRYARRALPAIRSDGDRRDASDTGAADAPVPAVQY